MTGKEMVDCLLEPINPFFCSLIGYFCIIKGLIFFNPFLHNPYQIFSYLFFGYSPLAVIMGILYIAVGTTLILTIRKKPKASSLLFPLRAAASLWLITSTIEFYLNPGLSTWVGPAFISIYCIFVASNFFINGKEKKENP